MTRPSKRQLTTAYTVEEVRKAASGTSFHQICHNKNSKLLSFRSGSTRINVYYQTGTIGTCLDDPTKGKTQLFRRNIDLGFLALLFKDPRIHSGKGYYTRKNLRQPWKILNSETGHPIDLPDSALRWMYVASATGLSNTALELWKIAVFCTTWDSAYWPDGCPPKLSQTRFQCGSTKALTNLVLEVCGAVIGRPIKGVYFGKEHGQTSESWEDITTGSNCCPKVQQFMDVHSTQLEQLKLLLFGFQRGIQIELMRWFFARSHCGYCLVLDDGCNTLVTTPYSSSVDYCQVDYANMAYTREEKLLMCRMHGVMFEPGPS